jgi:hypothetical protein
LVINEQGVSFEHNFSARIAIQNSELSPRALFRLAARSACVETLNSTDIERCNLRGIETPTFWGGNNDVRLDFRSVGPDALPSRVKRIDYRHAETDYDYVGILAITART